MEVIFTIIVVLTMIMPSLVIGLDHIFSHREEEISLAVWELEDVKSSAQTNQ